MLYEVITLALDDLARHGIREAPQDVVVRQLEVERVRLARAAVVDQHDVTLPADLAQEARDRAGEPGRPLPGASGEEEDRVRSYNFV